MIKKNTIAISAVLVIIFISLYIGNLFDSKNLEIAKLKQDQNKTTTIYKDKIIYKEPKGVIASITMADLDNDLKHIYKYISKADREIFLLAIAKSADRFNVNPVILYGVCDVETNFRPWVTHTQVVINGKKDNAIGIGGILPTYWMSKLRKAGIIETKSDLYNPTKNIMAIGFVLNEYKKSPMLKGTSDSTTSALRRYFGAKKQRVYTDKIRAVVGRILFAKIYD